MADEFNDFDEADPELPSASASGRLLVCRIADDVRLGTVSWHPVWHGPNRESRALNIGISLVPEARGQGYGTEAQRLLVSYLFETTDVHRVEAGVDIDNLAEQRALEKAGFAREGMLREAQARAFRRHDLVSYSKLRSDPP